MTVPGSNATDVANLIINRLTQAFRIDNYQIGQNIIEARATAVILSTPGVQALVDLQFVNRTGTVSGRQYSGYTYSFTANKFAGAFAIPQNAIFELRYPNFDITVNI